jgi:RimJ/RimL family protein N-acetyltransferase
MSSTQGKAAGAQLPTEPLQTERLTLRRPRATDAALIYDGYARDVDAIRWMGFHPHTSIVTTERLVAGWQASICRWAGERYGSSASRRRSRVRAFPGVAGLGDVCSAEPGIATRARRSAVESPRRCR